MANHVLDFTYTGRAGNERNSLRAQIVAAWSRLSLQYKRSEGPKIFANYYDGAAERVRGSEPVVSFKKFTG